MGAWNWSRGSWRFCVWLASTAASAYAQDTRAQLRGRLVDPSGSAISGAAVHAKINHPTFVSPSTTPSGTTFATASSESQWPRVLQFALKLMF